MYSELLYDLKQDPARLERELAESVEINHADLLTDITRQTAAYMKWAALSALASSEHKRLKRRINEEILPVARVEAQKALHDEGVRRPSLQKIEDFAVQSPAYREEIKKLEEAELLAALLRKAETAMEMRRDMLQSLNSRQKVELTGTPSSDDWAQEFDKRISETPQWGTKETRNSEKPFEELVDNWKRLRRQQ